MTDPRNSDSGAPRGFEAAGSRGANQSGSTGGTSSTGGASGTGNTGNTGGRPQQRATSDTSNRSGASAMGASGAGMGTTGATGGTAGSTGSTSKTEQAKEKAQHLADQAKEKATEGMETGLQRGKSRAAETLSGVAQSLRQGTGQQQLLGGSPNPGQQYVERAAQQVQRAADYLQKTEVDEMVERVESIARRQPALFLGGAFVLGLIGARFLKSSQRNQRETAVTLHDDRDAYGGVYGSASRGGAYGNAYGGTTGASGSAFVGDRDVTADQTIARESGAAPSGMPGMRGTERGGSIGGLDPDGSTDRR